MISVEKLCVHYGGIAALHDLSMEVPAGRIVTLIGANGAGKSTTLRAISGLIRPKSGSVRYGGEEITGLPAHSLVAKGMAHCPEGRMVFSNLTVKENLRMGAYVRRDSDEVAKDLEYVQKIFPRLQERMSQLSGTLSGGEQQMLAIARALMSRPKCLLLDEPSLGIAPMLVKSIFATVVELNRSRGLTILLVEQNAHLALEISDHAYVLETGRILLSGPASEVRDNPQVREAYLGG